MYYFYNQEYNSTCYSTARVVDFWEARPLAYATHFLRHFKLMSWTHSVNNYWTITKYQHLVYARYGSGDLWEGLCGDGYKMVPTGIGGK